MSSSRSCGGSHTLTSSQRRYTRLQGITPCALQEDGNIMSGLKGVVDLQGLDGHIYRGRMDIRLPAIHTMDGNSKSCAKISQGSETSLASWDIGTLPHLPQSAKQTGHNSETEERPCSASLRHLHAQADNLSCCWKNRGLRIDTTIKQQCVQKLVP
ncbi:glutamine-rich protein 2 isoform X2 [Pseudophryne corroboree]|uniref:glutamine-rich protein 2 isoform X2 n=1 Tax=Pseudophryne corroboree TaxID=495146 RepID=UPI00308157AD